LLNRGLTGADLRGSVELLRLQLDLLRPRVIVGLGTHACRALSALSGVSVRVDGAFRRVSRRDSTLGLDVMLAGCPHPSPLNFLPERRAVQERVFARLRRFAAGN
jgi:uracil-DNA glycosylase